MNKRMRKKAPRRALFQQLTREARMLQSGGVSAGGFHMVRLTRRDVVTAMKAGWLHIGYRGMFMRTNEPGAIVAGTAVIKVNSLPDHASPDGSRGIVMGSAKAPDTELIYFIEWDREPGLVRGVRASFVVVEGS